MADEGKPSEDGGTEEKRALVENQRAKTEGKAKLARSLEADQITVVGIELDVPGQGRVSLRPGGGGGGGAATTWDADLSDTKADSDPTDQFFDMDSTDGINDMDPTDPLRRGGHGGSGPLLG